MDTDLKVDVGDDHTSNTLNIGDDKLGPGDTEELWRFVLANSPEALVAKYPKLLQGYRKKQHFTGMDAVLTGLKKQSLNNKPVIIKGFNDKRQRFIIELHEHLSTPKPLLIKNENLQTLQPRSIDEALSTFKDDLGKEEWALLTLSDECHHNDELLMTFIRFQFPFYIRQTATKVGYDQLFADTLKYAKARNLGITTSDCPTLIALLYCICHYRKLHIMRVFVVPSNWTPQRWDKNLYVLQPPND